MTKHARKPKRRLPVRETALAAFVSIIGLALVVAGCGGGDDGGEKKASTPSTPPAATVNVKETEFKLDPANPKVNKTGVVAFKVTNDGKVEHSLEVEGPSGETELPEKIKPGASATLKVNLNKPGKYEFYCPVDDHKGLGMEGEIEVAGGKSSKTGASSAPQGSNESSGGGY